MADKSLTGALKAVPPGRKVDISSAAGNHVGRYLYRDGNGDWYRRRLVPAERHVAIVDLNNVLWTFSRPSAGIIPSLDALSPVIEALRNAGVRTIRAVADANIDHLVAANAGEKAAPMFDLFERVSAGEPADRRILQLARELPGFVVSNDRFRDWKKRDKWVKRNVYRLLLTVVPASDGGARLRGDVLPRPDFAFGSLMDELLDSPPQ